MEDDVTDEVFVAVLLGSTGVGVAASDVFCGDTVLTSVADVDSIREEVGVGIDFSGVEQEATRKNTSSQINKILGL